MPFLSDRPGFAWDEPIYIIGNPRSGTSLFRLMLHLQPEICIPPESHFYLWLRDPFSDWKGTDTETRLDDYLNGLYDSTKFETWELPKEGLRNFILDHRPDRYAELTCLVYLFYAEHTGSTPRFWGDKNKLWKEKLADVHADFPKARFIHVVRDGRDIACSFREIAKKELSSKYAPKVPVDIEHLSERWNRNIRAILEFQKTVDPDRFHTVIYEDLIRHTRREMEAACAFLGVPFRERILDYHNVEDPSAIEPEEFFGWKEKLLQPPDESNIGKFRERLSAAEIAIFNQIAREPLKHFGYL